ncbi:peptidase U32 family protein [Halothermothrix orenii]|uniref:Peptidase U32 n=1 Tax=Halothermothrix orenii (strain H 168 / OCM 544 / DSM 9562) TaxID=373903 RepID=B8CY59_HALOH|nr:U32 family peptidase [Halothermothrix orenii]ACL70228.1 peptidase U32 [Halothermothrix orenii H 168]
MMINNVELLAPAGKWEALETVIEAGADAVYLGGKKHNMRLLRTGFNFSNEELKEAVNLAHSRGVKIYVTVNNLQGDEELDEIAPYLQYLAEIEVDAFIVQDLGLLYLINELGLEVPVHSSVMMNVHNIDMARYLHDHGVRRFIVSRELSFDQVRHMTRETGFEYEYFIHGDMCFSQSGQCLLSGMVFGNSSNRGRCLKPCRWPYSLARYKNGYFEEGVEVKADGPYFLAVKDMCVFRHIPQLIRSGIVSFKIEGRMKPASQLKRIVSAYRTAIDRYLDDPVGYTVDEDIYRDLYDHRVRDFSTCFALKNPGSDGIGYTGEREPKFFSEAREEKKLNPDMDLDMDLKLDIDNPTDYSSGAKEVVALPLLSIKVNGLEEAEAALKSGVDRIYIGGETPSWKPPCGQEVINKVLDKAEKAGVEVVVTTPRITFSDEMEEYIELLKGLDLEQTGGVMAGNLGMIRALNEYFDTRVMADFGVNAFNTRALSILKESGVVQVTNQLESSLKQILKMASGTDMDLELIGHGHLPFMVSDHCLLSELLEGKTPEDQCSAPCRGERYGLVNDKKRVYPVMTDQYCRTHLYLSKELALLPFLDRILLSGIKSFRIEAGLYNAAKVEAVVDIYKRAFIAIKNGRWSQEKTSLYNELKGLSDTGYTLAAYEKGVLGTGT